MCEPGVLEPVSEWYDQEGRKSGFEIEDPENREREHAPPTTARHKAAQLAPGCVPWCWNQDMPGLYETSNASSSRMLKVALKDLMELA
jgi:hypothetical protein